MATSRLLALPAELRLDIYGLTFTPRFCAPEQDRDIRLAKAPSPCLLLVCKQVYKEAFSLFRPARQYWSDHANNLVIRTLHDSDRLGRHVCQLQEADLRQITNLKVTIICARAEPHETVSMVNARGVWKRTGSRRKAGTEQLCVVHSDNFSFDMNTGAYGQQMTVRQQMDNVLEVVKSILRRDEQAD